MSGDLVYLSAWFVRQDDGTLRLATEEEAIEARLGATTLAEVRKELARDES